MNESINPELALDEEKLEPRDWIATVKVTDRAMKLPQHQFVRSEEKKAVALKMRQIEREASKNLAEDEELDLTENVEYGTLIEKLAELEAADERVSWEDELEADQLRTEAEVEILALTHYHKTWNDLGRITFRGEPRYQIEVLDIRERAIQRPRLIVPGA